MSLSRTAKVILIIVAMSIALPDGLKASGPCEDPPMDVGAGPALQAASWVATVPYFAVKGLVALTGGVVSIPVYILSLTNEKATRAVWLPAVSGTYVLTPAHLTGKQPIRFWPSCPDE